MPRTRQIERPGSEDGAIEQKEGVALHPEREERLHQVHVATLEVSALLHDTGTGTRCGETGRP
jgi:hypothetical protein